MDTGSHSAGNDDDSTTTNAVDQDHDGDADRRAATSTHPNGDDQPYEEYPHGVFDQGAPEDDDDVDEGRSVFDQDEADRDGSPGQGVYEQGHPERAGEHGQGVYEQGHSDHHDVHPDETDGQHRAP